MCRQCLNFIAAYQAKTVLNILNVASNRRSNLQCFIKSFLATRPSEKAAAVCVLVSNVNHNVKIQNGKTSKGQGRDQRCKT